MSGSCQLSSLSSNFTRAAQNTHAGGPAILAKPRPGAVKGSIRQWCGQEREICLRRKAHEVRSGGTLKLGNGGQLVHGGPFCSLSRLRGEGRGEGPLHKGGLAESEGAFSRSPDSRRGPSPGICAKSAQIPTSPRERGEVRLPGCRLT